MVNQKPKTDNVHSLHKSRKKPYTQKELVDIGKQVLREYQALDIDEPENFASGKPEASTEGKEK